MIHVVDTHPLVWHLEGNPRLSAAARGVLTSPESEIVVPSIVVAEVWYLYHRKRISTSADDIRERILRARNCSIYPLDEAVLELLPAGLDIHDAVIVSAAKLYRDVLGQPVRLVTCDEAISRSGIVETLW